MSSRACASRSRRASAWRRRAPSSRACRAWRTRAAARCRCDAPTAAPAWPRPRAAPRARCRHRRAQRRRLRQRRRRRGPLGAPAARDELELSEPFGTGTDTALAKLNAELLLASEGGRTRLRRVPQRRAQPESAERRSLPLRRRPAAAAATAALRCDCARRAGGCCPRRSCARCRRASSRNRPGRRLRRSRVLRHSTARALSRRPKKGSPRHSRCLPDASQ